jgi:hypothetical protein
VRARRWLAVGGGLAGLLFIPLPRACDPRGEEVPPERYRELLRFDDTRAHQEVEAALRLVDPQGQLAPHFTLVDAALEVRFS